mgnify:CR=1 FL=1
MSSNLPTQESTDSGAEVKQFFNKYLTDRIEYPASEVDAVIGYFENRGFEKSSAISVSTALLQQAKIDNINVFKDVEERIINANSLLSEEYGKPILN